MATNRTLKLRFELHAQRHRELAAVAQRSEVRDTHLTLADLSRERASSADRIDQPSII